MSEGVIDSILLFALAAHTPDFYLDVKPGALLVCITLAQTAGKWALLGGFIDIADASWRHAASLEVWEETGMEVPPEQWAPFDLDTASDHILLVCEGDRFLLRWDGSPPPVNNETDALRVVREVEELAFPTHTAALSRYLEGTAADKSQLRSLVSKWGGG